MQACHHLQNLVNIIRNSMNILVANISKLTGKGEFFKYSIQGLDSGDVHEVEASHTNESILKCFSSLTEVKNNGGINKIIALVSDMVLTDSVEYLGDKITAFEYYRQCADKLKISDIVKIPIEDEDKKQRSISLILNDICENISSDDTVYIDGAGGVRTINNVIQLLTKILKYTGIRNPYTLYADLQNRPNCFIYDTKNFDNMTDLADAFNEFMTSGKSDQLKCCINKTENSNVHELVNMMCEFSDKIRLGNIDDIETTVSKLSEVTTKVEMENDASCMESVIIRRFIPIIREKFIGENDKTDYCRLVNWCLENSLVQQAVTIFTEKIPIYLFDHNILSLKNPDLFANYEEESKKNKMLPVHWQTNALYSYIMSETTALDPRVKELKTCLENGRTSNDTQIKSILNDVKKVKFPIKHVNNEVEKFCMEKGFSNKIALVNGLINNEKKCRELLGVGTIKEKEQNKFSAIDFILQNRRLKTTDFGFNVPVQKLADILYGYLYVKNIRNRINHASDAEMFTEEQKKKLVGYDFSLFDLVTVKKNIFRALNSITNCGDIIEKKSDVSEQERPSVIQPANTSSDVVKMTQLKFPKIVGKIDLSKISKK